VIACAWCCRRLRFADGAQAINYVASHDVQGFRNERLYEFLRNNAVIRTEERIKLAFGCLLTAVRIPLILAGEEFADEHDLSVGHPHKQMDPVNFDRLEDPRRQRVRNHVARLVQLRCQAPALGVNETDFLHADFTDGRRGAGMAARRPGAGPGGRRGELLLLRHARPGQSGVRVRRHQLAPPPRLAALGGRLPRTDTCRASGSVAYRSSPGRPRSTPWPSLALPRLFTQRGTSICGQAAPDLRGEHISNSSAPDGGRDPAAGWPRTRAAAADESACHANEHVDAEPDRSLRH
jgi:hypothetical protein